MTTFIARTDQESDLAVADLERELPIVGLASIIERRRKGHKKLKELERYLMLLRATHLVGAA